MHILSAKQFSAGQLEEIFDRADEMEKALKNPAKRRALAVKYNDQQLCSLFYQPSTRTRLSFETAALKIGMGVVSTENAREFSSAAKGETIEDTIRVLNQYDFAAIAIRHHEAGAAAAAAKVSQIPIINAGDGTGEHPTQALLDAYTIKKHFGRLDNLKVVLGGDLLHGRTTRSLSLLLSKFKNNFITFVSIAELQAGNDIKDGLRKSGTGFTETDDMAAAFKDADVVYWTRLQKEYITDPAKIPKDGFVITEASLKSLPKTAIIMHPLPRVDEIHPDVDADPRARYFEEAGNGLYIRMALLDMVMESK